MEPNLAPKFGTLIGCKGKGGQAPTHLLRITKSNTHKTLNTE